jgi:RING finger protein 121/175
MHDHPETGTLFLNNKTYDLSQLSPEERIRLQHESLHEKHKGHEAMHAEMVLILFATLIVSQVLLVFWKTKHAKSFQVCFEHIK